MLLLLKQIRIGESDMKKTKIAYVAYLLLLLGVCTLCMTNVLNKSIVITANVVVIAIVFLLCCNIFFVPRNMDHGVLLENKQKMKSDPILWKEMLFLEAPLVATLLVLVFLIK